MGLSQRRAALLARLRDRKQREREKLVLVEGVRAVHEALDGGAEARFGVLSEGAREGAAGRSIEARLVARGVEVDTVDAAAFDILSGTESPQGVLVVCRQVEASLAEVVSTGGPILVLDALQDPGNAGTLIRSAVAFGLTGVVALSGTVDPWGAKAVRSAAGTVFRTPIVRSDTRRALEAMEGAGRAILVASADGRPPTDGISAARAAGRPIALVVGNEGAGVSSAVRDVADAAIAVPMAGPVESLNAGIAGSILMYELTRE